MKKTKLFDFSEKCEQFTKKQDDSANIMYQDVQYLEEKREIIFMPNPKQEKETKNVMKTIVRQYNKEYLNFDFLWL